MGRTATDASADVSRRAGLLSIIAVGGAWSAFLVLLYQQGHSPSFALIPALRQPYYLFQALVVIPWLIVMWRVSAWTAARVAPPIAGRDLYGWWAIIAAGCLFGFHLAPEMIAYAVGGMDLLRKVVRWTMMLSVIATWCLGTLAVIRVSGCRPSRAAGAALAGLVVNGLLAGPVLR